MPATIFSITRSTGQIEEGPVGFSLVLLNSGRQLAYLAQRAEGAIFQVFCDRRGESFLPADPTTIRAFIEHEVNSGKKPATVRRYIATIGRAHMSLTWEAAVNACEPT